MRGVIWSLVLFVVRVGLGRSAATEFIKQESMNSLLNVSVMNSTQLNVLGLSAFNDGNISLALVYLERACVQSQFHDSAIVGNWLIAQRAFDETSPIVELSRLIPVYPESAVLPQALVDEFRMNPFEKVYVLIYNVLRRFPNKYGHWVLFADLHLQHNFIGGGRSPNAGLEFSEEALLVKYGLALFPRSPELLLLRSIHAVTYGETVCAAYFSEMASRHRGLDSGVIGGQHYAQVARVAAAHGTAVKDSQDIHTCVPNVEYHSRTRYQAVYEMLEQSAGADWSRVGNFSASDPYTANMLVTSSISTYSSADGHNLLHLPSLQVGCSSSEHCAHPGFLVADAVAAASTHFVTEAYDLRMLEDASVGLVYSSHTLEHLSHTLPPASCPSYPRPDASARGCDSEVGMALTEWRRVLAPGGRLLVSVPDIAILSTAMVHPLATSVDRWDWMRYMFGGQSNPYDFHKTGFYYELLEELLLARGFCNVTRVPGFWIFADASWHADRISLSVHTVAC